VWDPGSDYQVNALAVSGSTIYAGGAFTNIGGQFRSNIAALDATTGLATEWNPEAYNGVLALAVSGSIVYAGGSFQTVGGQTRINIAALDAVTGLATAWDPGEGGSVFALAVGGSTVYAGGNFTSMGGAMQSYFAAMQDSPTPTLLARFTAEATSVGVQLRWQFGEPGRVTHVALERATNQVGPWTSLDAGQSSHGRRN
jgi:hypothetical protein